MTRYSLRLLFGIIFLFYLLGLIYSLSSIQGYLSFKYLISPIIISFLIVFLVLLFSFLQHYLNNYFTYFFYNFSYILMSISFYFVLVTLILQGIRYFLKINISDILFGWFILGITFIILIISLINGFSYNLKNIYLKNKKITKNTKIVQISDVHLFGKNTKYKINRIFNKILKINPDYVVITGDLFDSPGKIPSNILEITKNFKKKIFFVFGNHEYIYGYDKVKKILNNTKIIILENKNYYDKKRNINIIGINYNIDKYNLKEKLEKIKINLNNYNILLYHEPRRVYYARNNGIDLMLSGHTHGNHLYPLSYVVRLMYNYYNGLYNIGKMKLYVNKGTSVWGPINRILCKNEITIINLIKK